MSNYATKRAELGLVEHNDSLYVPISHDELDGLIGRLMQLAELTGDSEQRGALKSELKHRTRDWLNDYYAQGGYQDYKFEENARITKID